MSLKSLLSLISATIPKCDPLGENTVKRGQMNIWKFKTAGFSRPFVGD
jgi:hypothetical protein